MSHRTSNEEWYRGSNRSGRVANSNRHDFRSSRDVFLRMPSQDEEGKRTPYYRSGSDRSLYRKPDQDRPYPPASWNPQRRTDERPGYRRQPSVKDMYNYSTNGGAEEEGYRRRKPNTQKQLHSTGRSRKNLQASREEAYHPPTEYPRRGTSGSRWVPRADNNDEDIKDLELSIKKQEALLRRERPTSSHLYSFPYDPDFPSVQESEVSSAGDSLGLSDESTMWPSKKDRYRRHTGRPTDSVTSSSGDSLGVSVETGTWPTKIDRYRRNVTRHANNDELPYTYSSSSQRRVLDTPREVFVEDTPDQQSSYHAETSTPRYTEKLYQTEKPSVPRYNNEQTYETDQQPRYSGQSYHNEPATRRPESRVEVAPGEFMRLRGADETWRAIRNDFYVPCECICCNSTIFCIQDATLVLCPNCRVVSPVENGADDGGVGLGFRMEELAKWQSEIVEQIAK